LHRLRPCRRRQQHQRGPLAAPATKSIEGVLHDHRLAFAATQRRQTRAQAAEALDQRARAGLLRRQCRLRREHPPIVRIVAPGQADLVAIIKHRQPRQRQQQGQRAALAGERDGVLRLLRGRRPRVTARVAMRRREEARHVMIPDDPPEHRARAGRRRLDLQQHRLDLTEPRRLVRQRVADRPHQREVEHAVEPVEPLGPEVVTNDIDAPTPRAREHLADEKRRLARDARAQFVGHTPGRRARHHRHRVDPQPVDIEALGPPDQILVHRPQRRRLLQPQVRQVVGEPARLDEAAPVARTEPTHARWIRAIEPCRSLRVTRAGLVHMVRHHVEQHPQPALVRRRDHPLERRLPADLRIDPTRIRHPVAVVTLIHVTVAATLAGLVGVGVDWRDPQRRHPHVREGAGLDLGRDAVQRAACARSRGSRRRQSDAARPTIAIRHDLIQQPVSPGLRRRLHERGDPRLRRATRPVLRGDHQRVLAARQACE